MRASCGATESRQGLIGLPVPPTTGSGLAANRNSWRPVAASSCSSSPSSNGMPKSRINRWCTGNTVPGAKGMASTAKLSAPSTAISRSASHSAASMSRPGSPSNETLSARPWRSAQPVRMQHDIAVADGNACLGRRALADRSHRSRHHPATDHPARRQCRATPRARRSAPSCRYRNVSRHWCCACRCRESRCTAHRRTRRDTAHRYACRCAAAAPRCPRRTGTRRADVRRRRSPRRRVP